MAQISRASLNTPARRTPDSSDEETITVRPRTQMIDVPPPSHDDSDEESIAARPNPRRSTRLDRKAPTAKPNHQSGGVKKTRSKKTTSKKTTRSTKPQWDPEIEYPAVGILEEDVEAEKHFLVAWEKVAGQEFSPSWSLEEDVGEYHRNEWNA